MTRGNGSTGATLKLQLLGLAFAGADLVFDSCADLHIRGLAMLRR